MTTKKYAFVFIVLFLTGLLPAQETYFVKFKENITDIEARAAITELAGDSFSEKQSVNRLVGNEYENHPLKSIYQINFQNEQTAGSFASKISGSGIIEYVQRSTVYKIDYIPNDSLVTEQWGLENIEAYGAWEITEGSDDLLIAVIDTGLDYEHPDLKNRIFINQAEDINNNGIFDESDINNIDDDGNGFVDDVFGWDFTDRVGFPFTSGSGDYLDWDNDPKDEQGHGTNVAGIAAAQVNNSRGIAGAAPKGKILNLRAFDPSGYGEEDDVAAAILYAVSAGADVINMSFGDNSFSYVLRDVIRYAYDNGVILVASAGNTSSDLPHYPSSYSEVISVGASNENSYVASFSNTGSTIDLVAPGQGIVTTEMGYNYGSSSGTSVAAPFVSAAAGMLKSINNEFSVDEIKQILKTTCDDIGDAGWDLSSGAGKLNMRRAFSISAPSDIKINFPYQDYATSGNSLDIEATVLSAYFKDFSLSYGTGYNPENWNSLITDSQNQTGRTILQSLDLSSFNDSVYTIRLNVNLSNGNSIEERVNFYVDRSAPKLSLVTAGPAWYGEKSTIFAAVFTNEPCLTRMYYRTIGSSEFEFITLDGFATNNQFVKEAHYGFIPKNLVQQGTTYEVYFEAENLVGLKTPLFSDGDNFIFTTESYFRLLPETKKSYTLPTGRLHKDLVNISGNRADHIFINEAVNPSYLHLYSFEGNSFTKVDSIKERILRQAGDFDKDGKTDLLNLFIRNTFLDEQQSVNSTQFENMYADSSGDAWPVLADDLDDDGKYEVIAIKGDSTISVYEVESDLSLSPEWEIDNFSEDGIYGNFLDSPSGSVTDIDNDGVKEFWMTDRDGDILGVKINGPDSYQNFVTVESGYFGMSSRLASGDYDGDGKEELAVLMQSLQDIDIAPFYIIYLFNIVDNQLNLIFNRVFIDPSVEFGSGFQKTESAVRLVDINNDGKDELTIFAFPYSWIFEHTSSGNDVIAYKENVNSGSVFAGDIDGNGVVEIGYTFPDKVEFYEYKASEKPNTPVILDSYSINNNSVFLRWIGEGDLSYIYRGTSVDDLQLEDSTFSKEYTDTDGLEENQTYYYAVSSYDFTQADPYSDLSGIADVYVHAPAKLVEAEISETGRSLIVTFSDKINVTVENLESFMISGYGRPNSISPNTQYSYMLGFESTLPSGNYRVVADELRDFYGSPVKRDSVEFSVEEIISTEEFFIESFEMSGSNSVKIKFNLPPDLNSVANLNNYQFNPSNYAVSAEIMVDEENTIEITTGYPLGSIGKEYTLRVVNMVSDAASGTIGINSGAGSYIVLSSFAESLSDIYTYPNPVNVNSSDKITFANLTRRVEIIIFSMNGKMIKTLRETDGNGGIDWDLKDESGNLVSSGVYIYRAKAMNDNGDEIETKLDKFAVIR